MRRKKEAGGSTFFRDSEKFAVRGDDISQYAPPSRKRETRGTPCGVPRVRGILSGNGFCQFRTMAFTASTSSTAWLRGMEPSTSPSASATQVSPSAR